jgi:hypothetical protein
VAVASTRPAATRPATQPLVIPADRLATSEEIHQLYDEENYTECLKQLARVLPLRGKAAQGYDKYELTMLRADCHLRMKATSAAIAAFGQAAGLTDDPKKAAVAKTMPVLLRRSKNFEYTPTAGKKGEGSAPIDVIEPKSRKKALQALLNDEMALVTPKVEKALDGKSLAAVAEALKSLQGLDVLEQAAGGEGEAQQLVQDLRDRGNALMKKVVERMDKRVTEIDQFANSMVQYQVNVPSVTGRLVTETRQRKRGLDKQDRADLETIIATCGQVAPNAEGLARATGGKIDDAEALADAANSLKRRAEKVLKADYR